jgi:hypothetical protein
MYLNGTVKHPKVIENMTVRTVKGYILHGCLREAVYIDGSKKEPVVD